MTRWNRNGTVSLASPRTLLPLCALAALLWLCLPGIAKAAPTWGITMTHQNAYGVNGAVDPYTGSATTFDRKSGQNKYTITVTNDGDQATAGTVTVADQLPDGLYLRNRGAGSAGQVAQGAGWQCFMPGTTEAVRDGTRAVTCTRSDALSPGDSYPPITLTVHVEAGAPDTVVNAATVSGGGASPLGATVSDPATVATVPFDIQSFVTSVSGSDGVTPFTQAGGHAFQASTTILVNSIPNDEGRTSPSGEVKDLQVDLPPGFVGNPQNVPPCPLDLLPSPLPIPLPGSACPIASAVGYIKVAFNGTANGAPPAMGGLGASSPVYLLRATPGHPAQFGFNMVNDPFILNAKVRSDGDYGLTVGDAFTGLPPVMAAQVTFCENGVAGALGNFSCTASPVAGHSGPFLTNPTQCSESAPKTTVRATNWMEPDAAPVSQDAYTGAASGEGPVASSFLTGCDQLKFEPTVSVAPESTQAGQPTGLGVHIHIPQLEDAEKPATPALRDAVVTLPQGMAVNPSLAEGLQGCTDAQWAEHDGQPGNCPLSSKIGTLEVTTPLLDHKLPGNLYVRQPDPGATRANGLYTIFLEVNDPKTGVIVKLRGSVVPDEKTGQLTATFKDNPQLPFSDLDLSFKGGPRGALVNPGSCGPYTTQAQLTPWAGEGSKAATPTSSFTVDAGPGGGACPDGGFDPKLEAGTAAAAAGQFSPFTLRVTRGDGQQNIAAIDATLPKGLTAKLAGVPLCGDADAATGNCPAASQIGTTTVGAGAGTDPLYIPQPGKSPTAVYLAGPYKGGPYSLVVKVPAQAGPFDLGNVTVRSAIDVNPETAQVSVKSDALPQILQGVPIAYRDIRVDVDRPGFTLNPTSCEPMSVDSTITSAQGKTATPSSRFQVGNCSALGFSPKLKLNLKGGTKRGKYPALKAVLTQPAGQANIGRVSVALPHSEFLAQEHIRTVCTRVQFAAEACPAGSIYGHAKAWTPLLEQPLEGPVYLRSSSNELPDLVAALHGQVDVDLVGRIDSVHGGIRNTFETVPDAPVTRFELNMQGGKKGLLVNSRDICKTTNKVTVKATGQNGRLSNTKPVLQAQCAKHKKAGSKTHQSRASLKRK